MANLRVRVCTSRGESAGGLERERRGRYGDRRAAHLLAPGHQVAEAFLDRRRPVFPAHLQQPRFGDVDGRDLGVQIAEGHLWQAHVGGDHVEQIIGALARAIDPQAREPQALVEDLGRLGRERAGNRAAEFGPVGHRDGKGGELALDEHRLDDPDVRKVGAAGEGIVRDVDVARLHGIAELADYGLDVALEGAGEHGDAVGLGQELRLGVGQATGEIQDLVNHRAHRGPRQHEPHLIGDGHKLVADDLERDVGATIARASILHRFP